MPGGFNTVIPIHVHDLEEIDGWNESEVRCKRLSVLKLYCSPENVYHSASLEKQAALCVQKAEVLA